MLQLSSITSQRGAILCLYDYIFDKYSDVILGVSRRCTCRNCKSRVIINITNTEVLKKVNHNNEHEDIANKNLL
jgi:hypothetical protein